jgi:anti-anti-sigma factor
MRSAEVADADPGKVTRRDGSVAVVRLGAKVDLAAATWLDRACRQLLDEGVTCIVVDLDHCESIDSTAIGVCLYNQSLLRARGGMLALVALRPAIATAVRELDIRRLLPFYDDADAAFAAAAKECAGSS